MQNDLFRQGIDWTLAHMLRFSSLIYEVKDCVVCQAKGCQPAMCWAKASDTLFGMGATVCMLPKICLSQEEYESCKDLKVISLLRREWLQEKERSTETYINTTQGATMPFVY